MPRLSILFLAVLLGCKKPSSQSVVTSLVQFQVNGDVYTFRDLTAPYYGTPPWILVDTGLFYLTAIPPCADAMGNTFRPLLQCTLGNDSLRPGMYTYVGTQANGGDLMYSANGQQRLWRILLSDTVTITSISNGYAFGTFSASYMVALDTPSVIHLTDGVFEGAQVLHHPPVP